MLAARVLVVVGCVVGMVQARSALAKPGVAAVEWDGESVYFFRGSEWVRFAKSTNTATDPKPIAGSWDCVKEPVDAAYVGAGTRAGKMYLFFGARWVRYDIAKNRCDGAPKPIAGSWPGLPWSSDIDAAVAYKGKAYFFKGNSYVRFSIDADSAETGAIPISDGWPGVWPDGIEQAIEWGNDKVYLLRAGQVISYDIATEKADGPAAPLASDPRFAAVDQAFRRGTSNPAPELTAYNCTDDQANAIKVAWNEALRRLENVVLPALRGRDPSKAAVVDAAYRAHFSTTEIGLARGQVLERFEQIVKLLSGPHTVTCVEVEAKCRETAFVLLPGTAQTPEQNRILRVYQHPVFFCDRFFSDEHASRRWVTVIHERAHQAGAGNDVYRGSEEYPPKWPGSYDNADSYAFSALHIYNGRAP